MTGDHDRYQSGDPYDTFAKQAGAVPAAGTKKTHGAIRELFKTCALGVQYAMGEESLALRLGKSPAHARELLRLHRATYPTFWRWSEAAVSYAMLHGKLWTVFGWEQRVGPGVNPRSLGNFPMQANGAEMLRLACCLATERGIRVCAPVHDAILINAPLDEFDVAVAAAQAAMEEASAIVLDGFRLRSDAKIVRYPDRYMDERGKTMWGTVQSSSATKRWVNDTCSSARRYLLTSDQVSILLSSSLYRCTSHPLSDVLNIDELRLRGSSPSVQVKHGGAPRHRPGERFLKGPISWAWLAAAGSSRGRALQVALVLWLEAGMKKSATVSLTHARLREMGVDRSAARRGLVQLERLGLVSVLRRNGAAPRVTIVTAVAHATDGRTRPSAAATAMAPHSPPE